MRYFYFIVFISLVNPLFAQDTLDCRSSSIREFEGTVTESDTMYVFFSADSAAFASIGMKGELMRRNKVKMRKGNLSWLKYIAEVEVVEIQGDMLKLKVIEDGEEGSLLMLIAKILKISSDSGIEFHAYKYQPCMDEEEYEEEGVALKGVGCICRHYKKGEWLSYTEDGILYKKEFYDRKGRLHGEVVYYHPNGKIRRKGECDSGKRRGKWYEYYPNDSIKQLQWYDSYGELTNRHVRYFENGKKKSEVVEKGSGEVHSFWYENGNLKKHYGLNSSGDTSGRVDYYYESGQLQSSIQFQTNMRKGKELHYFLNGQIEISGENRSGERDGVWRSFTEEGTVVEELSYFGGKKTGECRWFYPSGEVRIEAMFEHGSLTEGYKEYFKNGKPKLIGTYGVGMNLGMKEGKWKEYYENGNNKSKGGYVNDRMRGKWITWDETGVKTVKNYK